MPVETALDDIPVLAVTDIEASDLKHGRAIASSLPHDQTGTPDDPYWVLAMFNDKAIALGHAQDGMFLPKRVFNLP